MKKMKPMKNFVIHAHKIIWEADSILFIGFVKIEKSASKIYWRGFESGWCVDKK